MKKLIFLLAFFPIEIWGATGAYFQHKDKIDQQEFELVYQAISQVKPTKLVQHTLSYLQTSTATSTGLIYYCSSCATTPICISTGTTLAGQFSSPSNLTTKCQ